MTKSFKEYRDEKNSKKETMETSFGSHSLPKKKETMETSFGSHSLPKEKPIKEDKEEKDAFEFDKKPVDNSAYVKHTVTVAEHTHQHNQVAPMHSDKMSANELEAASDYTDSSTTINSMLHMHAKGHDISTKNKDEYRKTAKHLDNALNRHKTHDDMHVYTGIRYSPSKHFKKENGKLQSTATVNLPAFTSTSTSIQAARGFSEFTAHKNDVHHEVDSKTDEVRHILKIHAPKGTHAMSLMDHSFCPDEKEILLHRGHDIEIHHKPEKLDDKTYLWHAKIVGHNVADLSKPAE